MEKSAAMKSDWIATARTLSEALPYLQRYDGATVVVKLGGHAMGDDDALARFARDIVLMKQCNVHPIVAHGGGPMINAMLDKLGIESSFVAGKRVTDKATVEVVEMVLSGAVNKRIVQAINTQGGKAVGLSGKDANLIQCDKALGAGGEDIGFVGEPRKVDPSVLKTFLASDLIPVVAPLGAGASGETSGVKDGNGDVVTQLSGDDVRRLAAEGVIAGGMIPKTETALHALEGGTRAVAIIDGRAPHACLLELFTEHGAGTLIRL